MKISPTLEDLFWIFVAFSEPRSEATSERTFAPPKALDSIWKINQHVRLISNTTSRKHPVFLMAESTPILVNLDKSKTLTGKRKRTLLQPKVLKPGQKFMNALKQRQNCTVTTTDWCCQESWRWTAARCFIYRDRATTTTTTTNRIISISTL